MNNSANVTLNDEESNFPFKVTNSLYIDLIV